MTEIEATDVPAVLSEINARLARIEELIDRFLPYVERMVKNPFLRIGKH